MGAQATELLKYKPKMEEEFDRELFQRIKFLAMELRTHNPFFGLLATELWIAGPSKSVPTIGVSEKGSVVYNEDFMRSLEPGEIIAVLVHEALHIALDFWKRFKGLNLKVANWAHDFVINDIIVHSLSEISFKKSNGQVVKLNVKLPPNVLHDVKYRNKSGEEVYLILNNGIKEKAEAAKARFKEQMSDPAQKAAWERKEAINKALRESMVKGFEKLGDAQSEANSRTRTANPELEKRIAEFDDVLSDLESIEWVDTGIRADQPTNNPYDKPADPQEPAEPSSEQGDGNNPGQDADQQPGQDQGEEQSQARDQNQPESGDQGQNPSADQPNLPQDPKEKLKQDMNQSILDYAEKEEQRISDEYDNITPETSQEQNLDDLQKDLEKAADEYVDKVTKAPQDRPAQDQQAPEASEPQQGNEQSDENGNEGQQSEDQGPTQEGNEPGESGPGQEGDEPGENGPGQEGDQPGQPGDGTPDQSGRPQPGSGEPSGDMEDGPAAPGGSQGGSPSQGAGSPSGQGSQGGQPQQGQGNSQDQAQPSQQSGNEGGYDGPQKSEANARQDVEDVLSDIKQELANSLSGKSGGTPGLDQSMASGEDMMDQGAYEQAMKEMAEELGINELDNDIAMDCDDIPGNPYKNETPEETDSRKRQMFNRAIQEDMLSSSKMMGTLPGWLQKDINDILYPPLSFDKKVKKYIGHYGRETKRTFTKPNKRNTFMPGHMIRKGSVKNEAKLFVIQDTSGSMLQGSNLDNLKKSMGLIERLANNQGMEIVVIQCDVGVTARMNTREAMEMINKKQFKINGLGGSDFNAAFDMVWREMSQENNGKGHMICVFTDGEIAVPEMPPRSLRQQVLWMTNPGQNPPTTKWGEHLVMDNM